LASAFLTENADAQSDDHNNSANYVLPACQRYIARSNSNSLNTLREGLCAGLIEGLFYLAHLLPPERRSCAPESVTTGQVLRVAVAYIERRPQRMHENFKELALDAFHDAWPCR
jgi:hypothetical protein